MREYIFLKWLNFKLFLFLTKQFLNVLCQAAAAETAKSALPGKTGTEHTLISEAFSRNENSCSNTL